MIRDRDATCTHHDPRQLTIPRRSNLAGSPLRIISRTYPSYTSSAGFCTKKDGRLEISTELTGPYVRLTKGQSAVSVTMPCTLLRGAVLFCTRFVKTLQGAIRHFAGFVGHCRCECSELGTVDSLLYHTPPTPYSLTPHRILLKLSRSQ